MAIIYQQILSALASVWELIALALAAAAAYLLGRGFTRGGPENDRPSDAPVEEARRDERAATARRQELRDELSALKREQRALDDALSDADERVVSDLSTKEELRRWFRTQYGN